MHPDIGYRQGMHELLAPLYYAIDHDSLTDDADADPEVKEFCARAWVATDAWLLFDAVMKSAGRWYEWQEGKSHTDPSPLQSHVQLNVAGGEMGMKPYIAPIVEACNRVQSVLLKSIDPELWKAMQSAGIEPQIYGMYVESTHMLMPKADYRDSRWLRLLFTREFSMEDAMVMWDGLFAVDPSFDLAMWICVAMLMRIRNKRRSRIRCLVCENVGLMTSPNSDPRRLQHTADLPSPIPCQSRRRRRHPRTVRRPPHNYPHPPSLDVANVSYAHDWRRYYTCES